MVNLKNEINRKLAVAEKTPPENRLKTQNLNHFRIAYLTVFLNDCERADYEINQKRENAT